MVTTSIQDDKPAPFCPLVVMVADDFNPSKMNTKSMSPLQVSLSFFLFL